MRSSSAFRGAVSLAVLATVAMSFVACGSSGSGGLFTSTCTDVGKRPADLKDSTPTEVIVLLDVTDNSGESAKRISDDVAAVLDKVLTTNNDILLTGFTSGGTDGSLKKIDCMNSAEYFFGGGNARRQESERKELKGFLADAMSKAVTSTKVDPAGDSRVLLRQVPVVASRPNPKVILWSTFLEQGSDCLSFDQGDAPSAELANSVTTRCVEQNLLPDLGDAHLTVVGAGSSSDRPDLGPFGKQLATSLCDAMASECDVR